MTKVALVSASPKGPRATSYAMARTFLDEYSRLYPDHTVAERVLFDMDLPEFDEELNNAKFAPVFGEELTPSERAAWDRVVALVQDFASFDKIVIATPMWNYSIPYKLKHYLDILVQPFLTFGYDPETKARIGLLQNRPVQLILTRSSVSVGDVEDFQLPYLKTICGFMGLTDVRTIAATRTSQPTRDEREAYVASFTSALRDAAAKF